jgi:hypothetical protein
MVNHIAFKQYINCGDEEVGLRGRGPYTHACPQSAHPLKLPTRALECRGQGVGSGWESTQWDDVAHMIDVKQGNPVY